MITTFTCPRCGIQIRRQYDLGSNPCPISFELCCTCCMSTGRQMGNCFRTWEQAQEFKALLHKLTRKRA